MRAADNEAETRARILGDATASADHRPTRPERAKGDVTAPLKADEERAVERSHFSD
jgi:hypothetical protein